MQFTPFALALFSLVAAAPAPAQQGAATNVFLQGAQAGMVNAQQTHDALLNQIKQDPTHANADRISAYITGADSQIDNSIATMSRALAPFTGGMSEAIGNFLLGPFVQSVTNGAEVMLANVIGGGMDRANAAQYARLTGDYSRLAEFATKSNVDASKLINLNKQLVNMLPTEHKRAAADASNVFLQGAHAGMVNAQQTHDALLNQIKQDPAHANADRISAYITGADSQIDNSIATMSRALAPFTGGMSEAIGNFLLGPFVQSVTNGAEVMLANVIGGGMDRANAAQYARLTGDYSRLAEFATKSNVDASKLINLNKQLVNSLPK